MLRLFVELAGTREACLVAAVEKWRGPNYVPFEGPYGFGRDRVASGSAIAGAGGVVPVDIELGDSATLFRAGETLRLVVAARPLWPRNGITGRRTTSAIAPTGSCTLHWGPSFDAVLVLPVNPRR